MTTIRSIAALVAWAGFAAVASAQTRGMSTNQNLYTLACGTQGWNMPT